MPVPGDGGNMGKEAERKSAGDGKEKGYEAYTAGRGEYFAVLSDMPHMTADAYPDSVKRSAAAWAADESISDGRKTAAFSAAAFCGVAGAAGIIGDAGGGMNGVPAFFWWALLCCAFAAGAVLYGRMLKTHTPCGKEEAEYLLAAAAEAGCAAEIPVNGEGQIIPVLIPGRCARGEKRRTMYAALKAAERVPLDGPWTVKEWGNGFAALYPAGKYFYVPADRFLRCNLIGGQSSAWKYAGTDAAAGNSRSGT